MERKIRKEQWPSSAPTIIPTVGMHTEQGPRRAKGVLLGLFSSPCFHLPWPISTLHPLSPPPSHDTLCLVSKYITNMLPLLYIFLKSQTTFHMFWSKQHFTKSLLWTTCSLPTSLPLLPPSFIHSLGPSRAPHRPPSSWHYKLTFATTKQLVRSVSLPAGTQTHKDMWT